MKIFDLKNFASQNNQREWNTLYIACVIIKSLTMVFYKKYIFTFISFLS